MKKKGPKCKNGKTANETEKTFRLAHGRSLHRSD
jgi:hypothetical protein